MEDTDGGSACTQTQAKILLGAGVLGVQLSAVMPLKAPCRELQTYNFQMLASHLPTSLQSPTCTHFVASKRHHGSCNSSWVALLNLLT